MDDELERELNRIKFIVSCIEDEQPLDVDKEIAIINARAAMIPRELDPHPEDEEAVRKLLSPIAVEGVENCARIIKRVATIGEHFARLLVSDQREELVEGMRTAEGKGWHWTILSMMAADEVNQGRRKNSKKRQQRRGRTLGED